jgi:hypothetical protein
MLELLKRILKFVLPVLIVGSAGVYPVRAAESDIAKLPTFVLAAGVGILAPPVVIFGQNNSGTSLTRSVPNDATALDLFTWSVIDFNPYEDYSPPTGLVEYPFTAAPVDGYMQSVKDSLPVTTNYSYPLGNYFDSAPFKVNLNGPYIHPFGPGLSVGAGHTRPFFWQRFCPENDLPIQIAFTQWMC